MFQSDAIELDVLQWLTERCLRDSYLWRTQKIFMGVWFRVIWWSFGVRCLWRHNLTSLPCFQTNVLAKFV